MRDHCFHMIEYDELSGKKNAQSSTTRRVNHPKSAKKEAQKASIGNGRRPHPRFLSNRFRFCPAAIRKASLSHDMRNETGGILVVCSERWSGEESRRLIKHPWGARRVCLVVALGLMPGARNKRCRQARPLTGVGRLKERERPGDGDAHQCRTPVALGAQRSPTPVKGGIARVPWLRGMKGEKEYACSYTSVCFL